MESKLNNGINRTIETCIDNQYPLFIRYRKIDGSEVSNRVVYPKRQWVTVANKEVMSCYDICKKSPRTFRLDELEEVKQISKVRAFVFKVFGV